MNRLGRTAPHSFRELQAGGQVRVPRPRLCRQHLRRGLNFPPRRLHAGVDHHVLEQRAGQKGMDWLGRNIAERNSHLIRHMTEHSRSVQTPPPGLGIGTYAPETLEELRPVRVV